MRVVIGGGGIGGLALAQGLVRRGIEVVVLERDERLRDTGGYKLHLDPRACEAVRQVLPPHLVQTLYASAVATRGFRLDVRDHRGRFLAEASDERTGRGTPARASLDVDRVTLRLVLAEGLGERVLTGVTCDGIEQDDDGVRVACSDGRRIEADVAVIADGAGSPHAARLAGRPTASPTGLVGVAGRTDVRSAPASVREMLRHHPTLAIGPGGTGLFAARHDPVGGRGVVGRSLSVTDGEVVIWGVLTVAHELPERLGEAEPETLLGSASALLSRRGWADDLVRLATSARPETVSGFRLWAADPHDLAPWADGRVTAIGDAVHAMPPTGGQGAATAIRDAAVLSTALDAARRGEVTVPVALFDYRTSMQEYAAAAVAESVEPIRWITAGATPLGARVTTAATSALAAGQRVRALLRR